MVLPRGRKTAKIRFFAKIFTFKGTLKSFSYYLCTRVRQMDRKKPNRSAYWQVRPLPPLSPRDARCWHPVGTPKRERRFYRNVTGTYAMRTRCEWEWLGNESDNIQDNQHREKRAKGGSAHRTPKADSSITGRALNKERKTRKESGILCR